MKLYDDVSANAIIIVVANEEYVFMGENSDFTPAELKEAFESAVAEFSEWEDSQ